MRELHLNRFNKFLTQKIQKLYVTICWVRIDQRVGYELTESGCETPEPGYETSMGTKTTGYPWNQPDS